jgi:hypothetical protein
MNEHNERTRGHKLLPADLIAAMPAMGSGDGTGPTEDRLVGVKYFSPYSGAVWYALEGQVVGDDYEFFGWAELLPGCGELGYFMLSELAGASGMGGMLPLVERDCYVGTLTRTLGQFRKERAA